MVNNKIEIGGLNVFYDGVHALKDLDLKVREKEILGVIGPANSGKTSFLRCVNRLNDLHDNFKMAGKIMLDGKSIHEIDIHLLRKRIGIVFGGLEACEHNRLIAA